MKANISRGRGPRIPQQGVQVVRAKKLAQRRSALGVTLASILSSGAVRIRRYPGRG